MSEVVKEAHCSSCSHSYNPLNKKKNCVICGKELCSKCIIKNRFCQECYSAVPKDYKQKFRVYNVIPRIIFITLALTCFSFVFFIYPNWISTKWQKFYEIFFINSLLLMLFGVFISIAILLPELGDKLFIRWINRKENLAKVDAAIRLSKDGSYNPPSRLFKIKAKTTKYLRNTNFKALFIPAVILNSLMVLSWAIRTLSMFRYVSFFSGIVVEVGVIFNFLIVILALCLYKNPKHRKKAAMTKIWAIFIQLTTIIWYGFSLYYLALIGGIFGGDIFFIGLLLNIAYYFLQGSIITFIIFLLKSKDLLQFNAQNGGRITKNVIKSKLHKFFSIGKDFLILFLLFLIILSLLIVFQVLAGDHYMFFTFFSTPLVVGVYTPIGILLAFLIKSKKRKGHKQPFWIVFYLVGIIVIVNIIPIIHTQFYTNYSLDAQFTEVLGANWESKISDDELIKMRNYQYSFFDNLYNYEIEKNAKYNIPYLTDKPSLIKCDESENQTFYFDAYLPPEISFGKGQKLLPVLIFLHGEVEDKGPWNANYTSQYLANQGYLVCDMNYGYITRNEHGDNYNGYTLRQVVEQIGNFTKFLYQKRNYYHADLSNVYFSGRHLGGGLALICGLGYKTTLNGVFSSEMEIRGVIPLYPISDIGEKEDGWYRHMSSRGHGWIEGESDKEDEDYNPDWDDLNPIKIIDNDISPEGSLPIVLLFTGTHDYMIPMKYTENFVQTMKKNGHDIIVGYYLLGSDGYDGSHLSPWGQSVIYYYERFLALTH